MVRWGLHFGLCLSFCFAQAGFAEQNWEFVYEKEAIRVFKKEIPNSELMGFKGVTIMPAPITKVADVILDENPERKKRWIDMIMNFKVLEKSKYDTVFYSSYDLPWPIEDRDYVVQNHLIIDNKQKQLVFQLKSVNSTKAPPTLGVRAELSHSLYILKPLPGNRTEVTVEIVTDPKGNLPKWLVNIIQRSWPVNTLKKMQQEALSPESKENSFIKAEFKALEEFASIP